MKFEEILAEFINKMISALLRGKQKVSVVKEGGGRRLTEEGRREVRF